MIHLEGATQKNIWSTHILYEFLIDLTSEEKKSNEVPIVLSLNEFIKKRTQRIKIKLTESKYIKSQE